MNASSLVVVTVGPPAEVHGELNMAAYGDRDTSASFFKGFDGAQSQRTRAKLMRKRLSPGLRNPTYLLGIKHSIKNLFARIVWTGE